MDWFLLALNRAFNIDPIPLTLALLALAAVAWARRRVHKAMTTAAALPVTPPITGTAWTGALLAAADHEPIPVVMIAGSLADRFDPATRTLRLSAQARDGETIAALSLAAHAGGQALVATARRGPLVARFRDLTAQLVRLVPPAALLSIVTGFGFNILPLLHLGLYAFAGTVLLALVGVPLERQAAERALATLEQGDTLDPANHAALEPALQALAWRELAAVGVLGRAPQWQRRPTREPAIVTGS